MSGSDGQGSLERPAISPEITLSLPPELEFTEAEGLLLGLLGRGPHTVDARRGTNLGLGWVSGFPLGS